MKRFYKLALLPVLISLLLAGCTNTSKPDGTKPGDDATDITSGANDYADETGTPLFYSLDKIKIEDMDFKGVKFGDTRKDVVTKLGEPDGIEEMYGAYCYKDFTINFTEQDRVCEFTVINKEFSCYKNIKKGDDIFATIKKLPIPTTPSGIEVLYREFNGDNVNDLNILDEFFTINTEDYQITGEPNYYMRTISYYFENYILTLSFTSIKMAVNSEFGPGEIDGIWVQTADAPLFED